MSPTTTQPTGPPHGSTATEPPRQVELAVRGMTCAACATRVERKLNKLDGVRAGVNYATAVATVELSAEHEVEQLISTVRGAGYDAEPVSPPDAEPEPAAGGAAPDRVRDLWRRMLVAVVLFVPLCDLSILFTVVPQARFPGWQWLLVALTLPVAGWAAWPFHRAALRGARRGASSMDTLVSLGVTAAVGWSLYAMFARPDPVGEPGWWLLLNPQGALYLEVAAGVTAFVLAGRYFEARAQRRALVPVSRTAEVRTATTRCSRSQEVRTPRN